MLIYKPVRQYMSPQNISINPAVNNTFSLIIDGKQCIAYRFSVYDFSNDRKVPPSTAKVNLTETLYNGDTLEIVVASGSLTAGNDYKWMVELYANELTVSNVATSTGVLTSNNHNLNTGDTVYIQSTGSIPTGYSAFTLYYVRKYSSNTFGLYPTYEGAKSDTDGNDAIKPSNTGSGIISVSNVVISEQVPFKTSSVPTLTLSPTTITKQKYNFIPIYEHAEDVLVNSFVAELYNEDDVLLKSSGTVYSSNIRYEFDGLLSGNIYKVKFTAVNNNGQECTTGFVEFDVDYPQPTLNIKPSVINNYDDSSISIEWDAAIQTFGTVEGLYEYLEGGGIHLENGAILTFSEMAINNPSTIIYLWTPDSLSFIGIISKCINTDIEDYLCIGYNGTAFYRNQNGEIYLNYPQSLNEGMSYIIGLNSTDLVVVEVELS